MEQLEKTDVLGPQELAHFRVLHPQLPHNGIKASEPNGSIAEAISLSQIQAQQREMLDEKRVARFGNLSVGDWNADLELIEVKSEKGKFWQTMGYNAGSKKYLYPEEGLYLMELNLFELLHQGVPLSLQQAFDLLIPAEFSLEEYQTYAHLMRLGYITTRYTHHDVTEYEHRIRLYQQQSNRQQRACKKVQVWFDQIAKTTSVPNNSDSGELTDESYYSSSSGNGFSLKSAGDLNNKVMLAQQEKEEKEEKWSDAATVSEDNSSVYSDGPVSQMSAPAQENYDSDFNHSVVNLLDYHHRKLSSGSEQNVKILKRKHSSWYMTSVHSGGETSSASVTEMPPAKVRRESPTTEKPQRIVKKDKNLDIPMHVIEEKDLKMNFGAKDYFQSSDLGPSEKSEGDSLINIDEFLQAVLKQMNQGKKRKPRSLVKRPYSVWNFSQIRLPDMGTNNFIQDLPMVSVIPKTLDMKRDKISTGKLTKAPSEKESGNSLDEEVSGFNSIDSEGRGNSITGLLKKGVNILEKTAKCCPTNWMEYKAMLHTPEKDLSELLASPVGHLWNGPVQPLVRPSDSVNPDSLLKKLQVIQSSERKKISRSLNTTCKDVKITFNVHLPDGTYKKTCPGQPAFCVVIYNVQDPIPDLGVQMGLLHQAKTTPLLFSIVDNADITFCCFKDVEVPLGIT